MTSLLAVVQLAGSTCHCFAAAWTNMARERAPALRKCGHQARIELELPVA
jgi:hypothetical protein